MNGRYIRFTRPLVATAVAATLFPALASAITISWTGGDFVSGVTAPDPLTSLDILEIGAGTAKRFVGGMHLDHVGLTEFHVLVEGYR